MPPILMPGPSVATRVRACVARLSTSTRRIIGGLGHPFSWGTPLGQITKRAGLRGYSQTCRLPGLATTAPLILVTVGVGAADIVQQRVNAGLLDELAINRVPVLLGEGHPTSGSSLAFVEATEAMVGDVDAVAHHRFLAVGLRGRHGRFVSPAPRRSSPGRRAALARGDPPRLVRPRRRSSGGCRRHHPPRTAPRGRRCRLRRARRVAEPAHRQVGVSRHRTHRVHPSVVSLTAGFGRYSTG